MALPDWASDPDVLERLIHAALKAHDPKGAVGALKIMALCDPCRAQRLYDELRTAVHFAKGGDFRISIVPVGDRH